MPAIDRKSELEAKRAKLAEIKRQREQRQREITASRQSIGLDIPSEGSTTPSSRRAEARAEVDNLVSDLLSSRTGSPHPGTPVRSGSHGRPVGNRDSGSGFTSGMEDTEGEGESKAVERPVQKLSFAPMTTMYEFKAEPRPEIITYSKGVQADVEERPQARSRDAGVDADAGMDGDEGVDGALSPTTRARRRSQRQKEREEEIRQGLRKEIEDELRATLLGEENGAGAADAKQRYPARALTNEELNAVTTSDDFLEFVDRSTKVIERALDEEYDVLADYAAGTTAEDDDEDGFGTTAATRQRGRRMKEVFQFWDERWCRKRMVSDVDFSPKFPELILSSHTKNPAAPHEPDGLVLVWNTHMPSRPEYVFTSSSDILCAKFSPFHPNLILGGSYSGQVLLWDTRSSSRGGGAPVQRTPLTGGGHTHPVYSVHVVGTQNANNVISCSTDGVVCGWTVDMLSANPQEYLELAAPAAFSRTEDVPSTVVAFPESDPTTFLAGCEDGALYACQRYDRAGAKAGVDARTRFRGHAAPITGLEFHPSRGAVDLGDLVLSSGVDWTVKLWRSRPPSAAAASIAAGGVSTTEPLLEIHREDLVYDVRWSPVKPGVFALVDGAGAVEVWDLCVDVEVPVAKATPEGRKGSGGAGGLGMAQSLNKCRWEPQTGKRLAVGGLEGVVTVFEVGSELGGRESARPEEWASMKKLATRLDHSVNSSGGGGATNSNSTGK